ncbi:hypothetical protein ACFGVS_23710 [Mucilaginibacter sp. AW1-7]|uniref:hypothetical protein n=1 Tax=Mucilaginibacter sp. AW1-7 TaxID=3349874 RepID=UPI003F73475D
MEIYSVIYEGYNKKHNHFAKCFLLVKAELCNVDYCYERSIEFDYPVCSELEVQQITEDFCAATDDQLLDSFYIARETGCAFICLVDQLQSRQGFANTPRFGEIDFELLLTQMGGKKIPETTSKTPDFSLDDIVIELKDLQEEGLFDDERRKAIIKIFGGLEAHTINLDPIADYGELTPKYHAQIRNTIQNQVKKASSQIKSYKNQHNIKSAGIILLNTGMFSLPDDLFKSMVNHILIHQTRTVEFAFVFSQVMQSNGFDTIANFYCDFVGSVPDSVKALKQKVWELIELKMTDLMFSPEGTPSITSQHPISFFADNKIFYWNPGRLPDSRRNGSV